MTQDFRDFLARLTPAESPERLDLSAQALDVLVRRLAIILNDLGDANAQQSLLAFVNSQTLACLEEEKTRPQPMKLTPELLEWARSQINEEEIVAGLREFRTTGGLELSDFINELEQEATPRD